MKDFWAEELQNQRKNKLKNFSIFLLIIFILIIYGILIIVYMNNITFRNWCDEHILAKEIKQDRTRTIELDGDENTQIYAFDKYICIFKKKKLEIYNKLGKKIETIDLDITKAIFNEAGRYLAIAEENGQKFYLISGKDKLFENEVEGNISQIHVSASGYVSIVITNTTHKSIVDLYNKEGTEIFKRNLATSRVADVSISKDSKYLAIAEIDMSGILIKSNIQVISIETAQRDAQNAILYKYEAPTDKLIYNIEYQNKDDILCMFNDSVNLLKNNQCSEIINFREKNKSYISIELDNRILTIEEKAIGKFTSNTHAFITNPENFKVKEYMADNVVKNIHTFQNKIAINFGTELHIINTNGILLKKYISKTEINDIIMTGSFVGVVYKDSIQIINL